MTIIKKLFHSEYAHFLRLDYDARKLIISIILFSVISPIFSIFLNAYLWRQTHDLTFVAVYNLIYYGGILLGFYINGIILNKKPISLFYTSGLFFMGMSISILTFLNSIDIYNIVIFGLLYGIGGGLYWANRNLLTWKTTHSANRIYFSGLESTAGIITNIAVPFIAGAFIVYGQNIHLYSPVQAYQILSIFILLITVIFWFVVSGMNIVRLPVKNLFLKDPGTGWKYYRLFTFILGFISGLNIFIPTLIVLVLVGNENTLGAYQSIAALVSAVAVYILGKKMNIKHRLPLLQISIFFAIAGAAILNIFYNSFGVLIYYFAGSVSIPLQWIAVSSLNYDLIDEEKPDGANDFAYIFDKDLFLNPGRFLAIILFITFIMLFNNETALRFTPLLLGISQILLIPIGNLIENKIKK